MIPIRPIPPKDQYPYLGRLVPVIRYPGQITRYVRLPNQRIVPIAGLNAYDFCHGDQVRIVDYYTYNAVYVQLFRRVPAA